MVLFPDFELLDVFGPLEMFGMAPETFSIHLIAEKAGAIASRQGPKSVVEYVASVCTGSALLAKAGVLDGLRATTNKRAFEWATAQSDKVTWVKEARWVEDRNVFTSSGISAGMDMSLALIGKLLGPDKAELIATWAEYEWHRDASWDPFASVYGLTPE